LSFFLIEIHEASHLVSTVRVALGWFGKLDALFCVSDSLFGSPELMGGLCIDEYQGDDHAVRRRP
jgi:hypothetical protein